MSELGGAHVFVTGGSSGIGLAVGRRVLERGARLSIVARDQGKLDDAARELAGRSSPSRVVTASADVADPVALGGALDEVTARHGPVDVLVTCAGFAHPGHFEALEESVFRKQMAVDYFGTLHAVRAVVPTMIERRRGHLVLVSSVAGLLGVYGYSAYAPAKFAVRGLAETLRAELMPYGIVVSCAFPPDTLTPGFDAENELKPEATARISATIKPRAADHVARRIVHGLERGRHVITADFRTALLVRFGGLVAPLLRRSMDRHVRKATNEGRSS